MKKDTLRALNSSPLACFWKVYILIIGWTLPLVSDAWVKVARGSQGGWVVHDWARSVPILWKGNKRAFHCQEEFDLPPSCVRVYLRVRRLQSKIESAQAGNAGGLAVFSIQRVCLSDLFDRTLSGMGAVRSWSYAREFCKWYGWASLMNHGNQHESANDKSSNIRLRAHIAMMYHTRLSIQQQHPQDRVDHILRCNTN